MMIGPVGLLLLIGIGLFVWWLVKNAPGWVVALLGGGMLLMVGLPAMFMLTFTTTESRVGPDNRVGQVHEIRGGASETTDKKKHSLPNSHGGKEKIDRTAPSRREFDSSDNRPSTSASIEEFPYRGRRIVNDSPGGAPPWNLAIGGLLIVVIVGVGLLAGFVALCIYLIKKNPALIVLPVFGGLALVVVLAGFVWLAKRNVSYDYASMSDGSSSSEEPTEMQLETRYEVFAPASGGTVTEIAVLHNSTVKVGEVLLRLENQTLQEARTEKQIALAETDKQLKDGEESKQAELEIARSAQQAELDLIDLKISQLEIKSPAAGRVGGRNLHNLIGQTLEPGEVILHVFESNETPGAAKPAVPDKSDEPAAPADVAKPDTPEAPLWINIPSSRVDGVDRRTVVIGPYSDPDQYSDELDGQIHLVIHDYVQGMPGVERGHQFRVPNRYVYDNIIRAEYIETHEYSVGVMKRKFLLLEFDNRVKTEIEEMYRQQVVERRIDIAGFGSALMLMLLGTAYGYLKLDTRTKGYYTGRLKLAAGAAILLVVILAGNLYGYYW
jgi:hypothetical protein